MEFNAFDAIITIGKGVFILALVAGAGYGIWSLIKKGQNRY
jgi:hypothetical protein